MLLTHHNDTLNTYLIDANLFSGAPQNIAVAVVSQGEPWGLAIVHILTKLNYLSTLYVGRYQCTTVGRVGNRYMWQVVKLNTMVGKRKKNIGALRRILSNKCFPPWPETLPAPLK